MIKPEDIKSHIKECESALVDIRRRIHAYPELSYQEFKTVAYVKSILDDWGIENKSCTPTGLIATIKGERGNSYPKQTIALRADMDALPIEEKTNLPFASKNTGVMHACGHDIHTACLLGAIYALFRSAKDWSGTVRCLFQPGEEKNPGGASLMIKEGALKSPVPKAIVALHILPRLPLGKVAFNHGKVMASADEIYITIKAKGGHAASPHLTVDTVYLASKIVVDLQEIISRKKDPLIPSVLSICSFKGGETTNIIPSEVQLKGTFRSLDETWRYEAHELIKKYIQGMRQSNEKASILLDISIGYPCVLNDAFVSSAAKESAIVFMGKDNVQEQEVRMGAEDFGYYSQLIPACFFRLGVGSPSSIKNGTEPDLHTPYLNVNEKAIGIGAGNMAWIALGLLENISS